MWNLQTYKIRHYHTFYCSASLLKRHFGGMPQATQMKWCQFIIHLKYSSRGHLMHVPWWPPIQRWSRSAHHRQNDRSIANGKWGTLIAKCPYVFTPFNSCLSPSPLCSPTFPVMPSAFPPSGPPPIPVSYRLSSALSSFSCLTYEWYRISMLQFQPLIITSIKVALVPGPALVQQHISSRPIERQQGPTLNYWYQHN